VRESCSICTRSVVVLGFFIAAVEPLDRNISRCWPFGRVGANETTEEDTDDTEEEEEEE